MSASAGAIKEIIQQVSESERLRQPSSWILELGAGRLRRVSQTGDAVLGHPVHPLLTDLAIGFWTSAWLLDIIGGRRSATAARRLVGWGVVSAIPTIATGLGDAAQMGDRGRRLAAVHAGFNAAATIVFAGSWLARRNGSRSLGIMLGMGGAGLATVGGFLGGHLAFSPPDEDSVPQFADQ